MSKRPVKKKMSKPDPATKPDQDPSESIQTRTVPPPPSDPPKSPPTQAYAPSADEDNEQSTDADLPPQTDSADPESDTEAQLQAAKEQLLRTLAENENLRKRTQKEIQDAKQFAVEAFAKDLLSVPDNLSRALDALSATDRDQLTEAGTRLLDGIEMTRKDLHSVMERNGLTLITAKPGSPFDPDLHQAVSHVPSSFPKGMVAQNFQTGWSLRGRVLRAAMVAVSAGASPHSPPGGSVDIEA